MAENIGVDRLSAAEFMAVSAVRRAHRLAACSDRNGRMPCMHGSATVLQTQISPRHAVHATPPQLVGPSSYARGPTDAAAHNAFLVAVEPGDRLAGLVFRAASGTQVGAVSMPFQLVH